MRKVVTYVLLAIFVVNCSQFGKPKKPDNLISKKEMVSILVDLSLLSSAKGVNKRTLENNGISPEDYVYKTHQIDSLQFLNSNKYYSYNTEEYETILKNVEDSLNKLKQKYRKLVEESDTKELKAKQVKQNNTSKDSIRKKSREID
ncbi:MULTISPECIES: DUF4296 domain-containing protein [Bizionia]|uniref:DUF4296 domain-containing protein n=1 Tax=Bizionia algoritergicola TaxID=291187 RepID=A0A5D0QZT5_9FLAO|nr:MULTISPECIES: DUF4296 domain-containing protein [Bizionia]OBX23121.1 hypothetical protein BAA08_06200 [Bizionia sp. APA-3]TYB74783.1 DUF4296 domain-containing protein [Bizionia algoritergicola]